MGHRSYRTDWPVSKRYSSRGRLSIDFSPHHEISFLVAVIVDQVLTWFGPAALFRLVPVNGRRHQSRLTSDAL
ncbi:hypothetical protein Micbo1qcDRAFT_163689, partial [Microdochium bolleyi]